MAVSHVTSYLLSLTARRLSRKFDRSARSKGLNTARWRVLTAVARHEGSSQTELAEELEVDVMTFGRMVARIEAAGLIARRSDPADRRVRRLYITDSAKPIVALMHDLAEQQQQDMLRGFSPEECAMLDAFLERILTNLDS